MLIKQQKWKEPEYTPKQINDAGAVLRNTVLSTPERISALEIVDNWRAAHAYPLHVFYMNLRSKAASKDGVIVAERLKRLESIEKKIKKEKGMELYRMQDIGGCRMVVPSVDDVYRYSQDFRHSRIRHEFVNIKDYIKNPKSSGYRSLHMMYKFKSDSPSKAKFNERVMRIEIQFRTHLQHIWATAIETIGIFFNQDYKAGEGDPSIQRFFIIISSLFAIKEGMPLVPGTVDDKKALITEIKSLDNQYHILDKLKAIRKVMELDADSIPNKNGYYILELDYNQKTLRRWYFKPSETRIANAMYDQLEQEINGQPLDIVMVRAKSYGMVKQAYPNYFMDIGEFVDLVEEYIISETYIDEIIPDGII